MTGKTVQSHNNIFEHRMKLSFLLKKGCDSLKKYCIINPSRITVYHLEFRWNKRSRCFTNSIRTDSVFGFNTRKNKKRCPALSMSGDHRNQRHIFGNIGPIKIKIVAPTLPSHSRLCPSSSQVSSTEPRLVNIKYLRRRCYILFATNLGKSSKIHNNVVQGHRIFTRWL